MHASVQVVEQYCTSVHFRHAAARVFFRIWNMGGVNQPLGVPSLLLSPSLCPPSLPSLFPPLEVGPHKCRGLGSAVSSPRPQSKLNLVHFSLKI